MRMICVHEFLDVNKNMHTLFNVSIGEDWIWCSRIIEIGNDFIKKFYNHGISF
jgi:hypothetical protein